MGVEPTLDQEAGRATVLKTVRAVSRALTEVERKADCRIQSRPIGFRIGFEMEFLLRDFRNNWSIALEPALQKFTAQQPGDFSAEIFKVNYVSIETSLGIRRYFSMTKKTRIFLDAFVVLDKAVASSKIEWQPGNYIFPQSTVSYAFGAGVRHQNFSLGLRYYTKRTTFDLNAPGYTWSTSYDKMSLILGYRIFSPKIK